MGTDDFHENWATMKSNDSTVIDMAIAEMMSAKIIDRSQSLWSLPLVVVKIRPDVRRLLKFKLEIVILVSYPLPLIVDIIYLLGKAENFTALDLKSVYWHVKLGHLSKENSVCMS